MYLRTISLGVILLNTVHLSWADENLRRTITTSGEAVIYVQPDEVIFNFGIETRDANLDKALSANDEAAGKLISAIKKLGIEEKFIQTDHLNTNIVYREHNDLIISGYNVQRSYSVKLKDPKKFQTLVETVLKNGANRVSGFEFRTTELRKYRDKARAMAIAAAKEKAVALAAELNCKPGNPRTINETNNYAGYNWGSNRFTNGAQNAVQSVPSSEEVGDEGQLPLGQINVGANITISFDLLVPDQSSNTTDKS